MPLNVVSNFAANIAHRNLKTSDMQATNSLAKLSIGRRVVAAKDDAASMAIGSRMNSEVIGLKQAVVNAGQANSMLQIADGAMSTVSDLLTRMKSLSIQASSGNLSSQEREFLDVEFQALINEVDRVAEDTNFNGTKLVNGSISITTEATSGVAVAAGVAALSGQGLELGTTGTANFSVSFTAAATTGTGGDFEVTDGTNSYTASISADARNADGTLSRSTTLTLTSTTGSGSVNISLNSAFDATAAVAATTLTLAGSTELDLSFKLGTGTDAEDSLTFSIDSIGIDALGLAGTSIVTASDADSALEAINNSIDTLNGFRADVGAAQNRLDFASANLSISIENAESARSTLLDLDVAAEMTQFSSKQILVQSGVAMLAQANQLPQNLLRLLQ